MEAGRLRRNEEADLHDADGGSAHGSGLQSPWIPGGSCGLLHAGLAGAPASCIEERHVTSTGHRSARPAGACDPLGGCLTHSLPPPDRRHPGRSSRSAPEGSVEQDARTDQECHAAEGQQASHLVCSASQP